LKIQVSAVFRDKAGLEEIIFTPKAWAKNQKTLFDD